MLEATTTAMMALEKFLPNVNDLILNYVGNYVTVSGS